MAEGETIPLLDVTKGEDDDEDEEGGTPYQSTSTSTSIDQGYLGYSEYMAERKRIQWEIKAEEKKPADIRERDEKYEMMRTAGETLKSYFPDYNPNDSTFNPILKDDGSIWGQLTSRRDNKPHLIIKSDGDYADNLDSLPDGIKKSLGVDAITQIEKNYGLIEELEKLTEKNKELENSLKGLYSVLDSHSDEIGIYEKTEKELRQFIEKQQVEIAEKKSLFDKTVKQNIELKTKVEKILEETKLYKAEIDKYKKDKLNISKLQESNKRLRSEIDELREQNRRNIISNEEQRSDIEGKNEEIIRKLPLRERIKQIFKKYNFTVFSIVIATSVVIGVIVSNLSKGLSTLGKGVGNGLKTLGKKLGEILPGMVGAIVSFLFKTAGEVIGFLGKNAWLLIMAVVLYFVENIKKRK